MNNTAGNNTVNIRDYNSTYFIAQAFTTNYPSMYCKPTTTKEMENIIKSLKAKNSHGYDGITTKVLQLSSPFISSPLNYINNKILSTGIFPNRLKYSIIKPFFKKATSMMYQITDQYHY
jgi:hypothetical protein